MAAEEPAASPDGGGGPSAAAAAEGPATAAGGTECERHSPGLATHEEAAAEGILLLVSRRP